MRTLEANGTKQILLGLILALTVMLTQPTMAAGPAPIDLKSCNHFTILAYSTITSTSGGAINGDMGLSPAGSLVGFPPATNNGTFYNGGPIATQAQADLAAAYNDAAGRTPTTTYPPIQDLGGLILTNGVYNDPSSFAITGTLTLDAQGDPNAVWIFQAGSTLDTAVGSRVVLTHGAQACNVFWQVGSSATLGTSCDFKGTILATVSITMNAGSILDGRALAQTGTVTFNGNSGSLPTPEAPSFTDISRAANDSITVVLNTTPYFLLTLQTSPDLLLTNWTTIATDTPITTPWTFTNNVAAGVPWLFYRAFITAY